MLLSVENHGTICLLQPHDKRAANWLLENLAQDEEVLQWQGARVVEPRYVAPIVEGFLEAGGELVK